MLNLNDIEVSTPAILSGQHFDYKCCFDEVNFETPRISLVSSIVAYLFYDYETASLLMEICRPLKENMQQSMLITIFYFYDGLIASIRARNSNNIEESIKTIEESIHNLKLFAANAPENYLNKLHFLLAELAVIQKKNSEAESNYQTAISLSNKNGFVNEEAMACERYAIFHLELKQQLDAKKRLVQSFHCYKVNLII